MLVEHASRHTQKNCCFCRRANDPLLGAVLQLLVRAFLEAEPLDDEAGDFSQPALLLTALHAGMAHKGRVVREHFRQFISERFLDEAALDTLPLGFLSTVLR